MMPVGITHTPYTYRQPRWHWIAHLLTTEIAVPVLVVAVSRIFLGKAQLLLGKLC